MRRQGFVVLAAVVLVFALAANSQAVMTRVFVDGFTTNYNDAAQKQMNIWIQVFDSEKSDGPSFVKSITVTAPAPDSSVFTLNVTKDWLHNDHAYWKVLYASDFTTKTIPTGTYIVTVVPLSGYSITEYDSVVASFLPTPTVTYPTNGSIGVPATPKLTWTVPAAPAGLTYSYYRILLWDNTWNEPVYWTSFGHSMRTDFTYFTIPAGVLQPGRQYKFRIEARAGAQDTDQRSRSDWVTFTTGTW